MNPRLTFSFVSTAILALAATGLVLKADPAVAQQVSEAMDEVVVQAPITVRQVGRSSIFGARIELIELKRRVRYADLDLSKHADVIELETRVETVAKESCKKLSAMYPLDSATEGQRCIKKAINSAEEQVQAAIVAAI